MLYFYTVDTRCFTSFFPSTLLLIRPHTQSSWQDLQLVPQCGWSLRFTSTLRRCSLKFEVGGRFVLNCRLIHIIGRSWKYNIWTMLNIWLGIFWSRIFVPKLSLIDGISCRMRQEWTHLPRWCALYIIYYRGRMVYGFI